MSAHNAQLYKKTPFSTFEKESLSISVYAWEHRPLFGVLTPTNVIITKMNSTIENHTIQ